AHITGKSNDTTAAGAAIFFWARVAHLIVYVAGLKYVRTIAWFGGWAGGVMILMQLFK
ncbi:MAG: MAPEG family protein, partial [Bradyrhizobium sp.]|nr:MAPEG family protein [Bradyrhizobium sp.]